MACSAAGGIILTPLAAAAVGAASVADSTCACCPAAASAVIPLDEIALVIAGLNGPHYTDNQQLAYYLSLLRLVALVRPLPLPLQPPTAAAALPPPGMVLQLPDLLSRDPPATGHPAPQCPGEYNSRLLLLAQWLCYPAMRWVR